MSHTVIITQSVVVPPPTGAAALAAEENIPVEVSVKWAPNHAWTEQQQAKFQQRLLKKIAKIGEPEEAHD